MGKSISTVLYELKVVNPNSIANFDTGKLVKACGDDLSEFVGKPTQGMVVKASEAKAIVDKAKEDLIKKKVSQPWFRAGISGADLIFLCTDIKGGSYEKSCVLVAGYVALRQKLKDQEGMVVNLDKGDKVIDQAAKDMGKAMGTKPVVGDKAKFAGIQGSAPIVLLAHGDEDKTSTGQIYGKDFAGKQPADLVKLLLDNPDPRKQLSLEYSGVIYLDGCFTAQGGAMQNYCQQVWNLLKGRGMNNVSVKGNLGAAATLKGGDELVTTTEAEEKVEKLSQQAEAAYKKAAEPHENKRKDVWVKKYQKKNDVAGFRKDPEIIKAESEIAKLEKLFADRLLAEAKKVPGWQVKNLVGNFGLQRLN